MEVFTGALWVERAKTLPPSARRRCFQVLAQRMRLRRACCDPRLAVPDAAITGAKLEAFAGIVEERVANKHKALVFSQFVDYLHLLRGERDRMKVSRPHNPSLNSKRSPAQYAPESYRKISTAG